MTPQERQFWGCLVTLYRMQDSLLVPIMQVTLEGEKCPGKGCANTHTHTQQRENKVSWLVTVGRSRHCRKKSTSYFEAVLKTPHDEEIQCYN